MPLITAAEEAVKALEEAVAKRSGKVSGNLGGAFKDLVKLTEPSPAVWVDSATGKSITLQGTMDANSLEQGRQRALSAIKIKQEHAAQAEKEAAAAKAKTQEHPAPQPQDFDFEELRKAVDAQQETEATYQLTSTGAEITVRKPTKLNASGESAASLEAQSRLAQEQAKGQDRILIEADGTSYPLIGVDAVDVKARGGQIIIQKGIGANEWTPISKGPDVKDAHVTGIINRFINGSH